MTNLGLPEEAEKYFNGEAEELLLKLRPARMEEREKRKGKWSDSDAPVTPIPEAEIVGEVALTGTVNGLGRELSKYFQTDDGPVGLADEDYQGFDNLMSRLCGRAEVRDTLSLTFVKDVFFAWAEARYKGQIPQSEGFVGHLTEKAEAEVRSRKISIPISYLVIERPLKIGNVTFEYFSKGLYDELEKNIREASGQQNKTVEVEILRFRKRCQGVVFSSMSVCAETNKCVEIATRETEKALIVLRLFSATTFVPEIPAYFGMMGKTNIPGSYVWVFENGLGQTLEGTDESRDYRFRLSQSEVEFHRQNGLNEASELIAKEKRTQFEDLLMACLSLFSRAVQANDLHDRLVLVLASIETLLLGDASEPVQATVGLRLSFMCATEVKDRKDTMRIVKKAYALRSGYLHHGRDETDLELTRDLQHRVWTAIRNVLIAKDRFKNREQFLEWIEELVLSGETVI